MEVSYQILGKKLDSCQRQFIFFSFYEGLYIWSSRMLGCSPMSLDDVGTCEILEGSQVEGAIKKLN